MFALLELRMLSIENARGLLVRGEGWVPIGRSGSGILRNGRKRNGFEIGSVGGGDAIVDPDEE